MATVIELVMGSDRDPSAGIHGFEEKVSVVFHGPFEVSDEDVEFLCKTFAEIADGWCIRMGD